MPHRVYHVLITAEFEENKKEFPEEKVIYDGVDASVYTTENNIISHHLIKLIGSEIVYCLIIGMSVVISVSERNGKLVYTQTLKSHE